MQTNCFRFAPRDSVPGLIAKICKYLKDHPGWSEEELEEEIRAIIGQTGVESFNGRTGVVDLNEDDVNNLKIASAYFAEGDETIDELDIVDLYNQGVRFVFTNWNSVISGYDLAFVLDYFSGSNDVVYYPMASGSGGGDIVSVNGKTGIVELSLSDIIGDSGAQVKLCTATEFSSTSLATWNAYYDDGYRIVGVVNSDVTAIDYIYLLKQDTNNHQPIGLSTGASDAYTPTNPPPYPVTSVNGSTGSVSVSELRYGTITPNVSAATLQLVSGRTPYVQSDGVGSYEGMAFAGYLDIEKDKVIHRVVTPAKGTRFVEEYNTINPPPYPVMSVNGKTGVVEGLYAEDNPPPYPVTKVNGSDGDVIVTNLYSPNKSVRILSYESGADIARIVASENVYQSISTLTNLYFDANNNFVAGVKRGDENWVTSTLYSTKNPPPSTSIIKLSPPIFTEEDSPSVKIYFADIASHQNAKLVILRYGCAAAADCSFEIKNEDTVVAMGVLDYDGTQYSPSATGFVVIPYSILSNGYFSLEASSLKAGTVMYTRNSEWEAWVLE